MKQQIRSISMVLAFLVGGIFHSGIAPLNVLLPVGIAVMLSITFIGIDTARLKPRLMHLWVLLGIEAIGLGAFALARLCGQPTLAEALYYCGCAPIAAAAPIIMVLLKGDLEFITTGMLLSHGVFALLTPFILPLVVHDAQLGYVEFMLMVARQLATVLAAPAVIAVTLRLLYQPCRLWAPKLKDVSLGIWIFNLTIISATGIDRIIAMDYSIAQMWPMAAGSALVCATGFIGGYWLGYPTLKRECSQSLGQKNTVLTLYIASQSYATPLAYLGPVFYVFYHNIANAIQLALATREEKKRAEKDGATHAEKA